LLEIAAQQLRDLEQNIQVNSDTWTRLSATRHALINETPELQKPFAIECTECVNAAILLIQTDLDSLQASKAIKQTYKQIQETLAHANGLLQEISKIKGVDKDHPEYELFKQGLDIPIKAWEDFIKRLGIMLLAMG
jgi:chromosome segregation ATPase